MTGCSMAAKRMGNNLITGKQKIGDVSNSMKTATASTKALGVAMNVFANVGFILAITAISKVVSELAQAQENAVQATKEATEVYNDEISSIDDYKTKLSELHEELNSGNLSYEETKTKRTELMSIQDELIEKFGTEKSAIESVTEAINGQVDALDALNEKSYRDWVAKADEQTFWNQLLPGGKSGLDQAIDYMETDQTVSFYDMQNANLSEELQTIQKEIDETIKAKYNLDKTFAMFNVTGAPEEIKSQLEAIRQDYLDLSKDAFLENGISSEMWEEYRKEAVESINEVINKFDNGLEKHQETYQTYIEGMIKYDSEYSDEYATILQKRAELESAQNSGNEEAIQKARQAFMDAIDKGIEESGSNENIRKYFESLYPELQSEFSSWNFEIALDANTDGLTDIANKIGEKYTATDLLGLVDDDSTVIADSAFNSLIDKAIEYGICTDKSAEEVQKLIDLLVELGIVQDNVKGNTFNNETTNLLGISETVTELNTKLKPAMDELKSAYQSIFTEDGFTLDNVSSSMLSSIQDSILALNNLEGADIDISIEDFEKFADVLTNVNTTEEQADDAFDNLATSIINGIGVTGQLSDETAGLVVQLLEEMGIVNANEVVTNALALQKERLSQASKISSETTYEHAVELMNEAGASEIAGMALAQLALEKIHVNGQAISTSADIENIIALANAAGASAEALATLTQAKAILAGGDAYGRTQQDWASNVLSQINNGTYEYGFNLDADDFKVDFKGVGKDSASKAGKDAGEAYKEALENELSDLDKIINHIGGLFDDQIDELETAKDKAIKALEDARDKEIEGLEKQKKALEDQKDSLEDYKDALEDANRGRKLQQELMLAEYNLQKMLNQKTALIYKGGQMVYETDTSGVRDARDKVAEAELNIELNEIDEKIEAIDDKIEGIDDKIETVEEKYEKLIEETETYYDAQIKSLEMMKDQLDSIKEAAEAQEILALLEKYGISVEGILSGNEEALAKLKDRYLEVANALNNYEANGAMDELATSSDNAASAVNNTADAIGNVATNSEGVSEDINSINTALDTLSNNTKLEGIKFAFNELLGVIKNIATELGTTTENMQATGGLIGAIQALNEAQISTELLNQFTELESAINAVTTAIAGGGEGQNLPQGGAPTKQGAMTPSGSPDSAGTGGLKQAIKEQVEEAKNLLPEEIAKFAGEEDSLLSAVTKVTTAIAGGGDSEGGEKKEQSGQGEGETDTSHLMGALDAQYKEAEIKIPQERDWFNELATAIELCVTHLTTMSELLQGLTTGDLQFGLVNFHSQGTVGKAFAKGTGKYKGLPSSEKNALRSEYGQPELTVYPDGTTELTTEPTMSDLPKDTVIFNEEQTRRIMKNKGTVLGNAHSEGTITLANGAILQPANLGYDVDALVQSLKNNMDYIINPLSSIDKNVDTIMRTTNNISNVNNNNKPNYVLNGGVHVTCPNVTDAEIAKRVGGEIEKAFFGMSNLANQRASITR